jgi:hypothetical protein
MKAMGRPLLKEQAFVMKMDRSIGVLIVKLMKSRTSQSNATNKHLSVKINIHIISTKTFQAPRFCTKDAIYIALLCHSTFRGCAITINPWGFRLE